MKLTRASTYALSALAYMARSNANRPIASHKVAEAQGIPERFLLKVLKPLVSARVLLSIKGPNGGYRLTKSAKEIDLLQVVEAVDGPIRGHVPAWTEKAHPLQLGLQRFADSTARRERQEMQKVTLDKMAAWGTGKK